VCRYACGFEFRSSAFIGQIWVLNLQEESRLIETASITPEPPELLASQGPTILLLALRVATSADHLEPLLLPCLERVNSIDTSNNPRTANAITTLLSLQDPVTAASVLCARVGMYGCWFPGVARIRSVWPESSTRSWDRPITRLVTGQQNRTTRHPRHQTGHRTGDCNQIG